MDGLVRLIGREAYCPYVGGHEACQTAADRDFEHAVVHPTERDVERPIIPKERTK